MTIQSTAEILRAIHDTSLFLCVECQENVLETDLEKENGFCSTCFKHPIVITIPVVPDSYSCQFCGKEFIAPEQSIVSGVSPLCSYKCKFNLIYKTLKRYTNPELKLLWEINFPEIDFPESRTDLIFQLTKSVMKGGSKQVSSVSSVSSNECSELSGFTRDIPNSFGCVVKKTTNEVCSLVSIYELSEQ